MCASTAFYPKCAEKDTLEMWGEQGVMEYRAGTKHPPISKPQDEGAAPGATNAGGLVYIEN